MSVMGATVWEVLWTIFAGSIIVGLLVQLIADSLKGKTTWPGRIGALLFIPAGIAMGEGSVPALAASLLAMAALALIDRYLRKSRTAPAGGTDAAST
jgi:hypothetical protein